MTNPLRKEHEELTTSDIAESNRPKGAEHAIEENRPKLVQSERNLAGGAGATQTTTGTRDEIQATPLFPDKELQEFRKNWDRIQTGFVDEPRKAVEHADRLVASTMKRLAEVFADERGRMEKQWDRGDNVSTEELRVALQRYRSFFHRLLAI